jgi:hypothetical protein
MLMGQVSKFPDLIPMCVCYLFLVKCALSCLLWRTVNIIAGQKSCIWVKKAYVNGLPLLAGSRSCMFKIYDLNKRDFLQDPV